MASTIPSKALTNAKNKARGAVTNLRPTIKAIAQRGDAAPVEKTSTWDARQLTTYRLNQAIEGARKGLSNSDLQKFNVWLDGFLAAVDMNAKALGTPFPALGIFPKDLYADNLEKEIERCAGRLGERIKDLILFAKQAKKIADLIGQREYELAANQLEIEKEKEGYSFWYVETHLALTRLIYGVEKLKQVAESLSLGDYGHRRFLLRNFGVRNEPAQSSVRFRSAMKKVLDESDLSGSLVTYLKYRLYGGLEPRSAVLADILSYEQTTSVIDLFFTFTKVCNLIISQPRHFSTAVLERAKHGLDGISAAITAFSADMSFEERTSSRINALAVDVFNHLFSENVSPLCSDIQAVSAVAAQLSTRGNQLQTDEASKAFLNMNWLPVANAIGEIQDIPSLPALVLNNDVTTAASPFLLELYQLLESPAEKPFVDEARAILQKFWEINAIKRTKSPDELVQYLETELKNAAPGNIADALMVLYADALLNAGALQECVSVCAFAGQSNERLLPLLPFAALFIGKRWINLRTLGPSVDLSIALSHASKVINDEKLKTFKRYATEELLTKHSCMTVDELIPILANDTSHESVSYFGYNVCDIPTLELLPGMGESRLVRRTRAAILRNLSALNTGRAVMFQSEAQAIEDALQVDDGLSVLDDSKVHVDEDAVVNFVVNEYQADFQRYKKLVSNGVGRAESINDILKNIDSPSARIFQIPKNDADDLLVQLINNIMQRFLYDPASGLDIIIGRRIRHNTISNELRGVLEKDELIGIIHHGRYQPSKAVVRSCGTMLPKQRKIIYGANARFSEAIDQVVALLRDQYFYVRSRSKPRGVFELAVTPVLFNLVRSTAQTCNDIEQFTRECIDAFWVLLSFKLERTRTDTENEIRRMLRTAFQKFSSELVTQSAEITLISVVQRAAEELQRRATTIASWIDVPKVRLQTRPYDLRKTVDVAMAVVTGQLAGFDPVVTQDIRTDLQLDSRGFAIVSDALYVVFYNIAQHSGKKVKNQIKVQIDFDENQSILRFDVMNEIAASARKQEKINKLQLIRSEIQKKAFVDGARKNKNSGFYKLAALVHQSPNTHLYFDFVQKDRFKVNFELEFISLNRQVKG